MALFDTPDHKRNLWNEKPKNQSVKPGLHIRQLCRVQTSDIHKTWIPRRSHAEAIIQVGFPTAFFSPTDPIVDGQNSAAPKKPCNDDSPVHTNKQWFPMFFRWCRIPSIHRSGCKFGQVSLEIAQVSALRFMGLTKYREFWDNFRQGRRALATFDHFPGVRFAWMLGLYLFAN